MNCLQTILRSPHRKVPVQDLIPTIGDSLLGEIPFPAFHLPGTQFEF